MNRVRWEDWQQVRRSLGASPLVAASRDNVARKKPRTDDERRMLVRAAVDAVKQAESCGRIVWLGPRHALMATTAADSLT